jgi:hypothetical protein
MIKSLRPGGGAGSLKCDVSRRAIGATGSTYRNEGDAHLVMKPPAGPSSSEAPPPTADPALPVSSLYFLHRALQAARSRLLNRAAYR